MALTQQTVLEILHSIPSPTGPGSLVQSGAVKNVAVDGDAVRVDLAVEADRPGATTGLKEQVESRLLEHALVGAAEVRVQVALAAARPAPPPPPPTWADRIAGIRHVVAVASGKGGVGKSTVAANLALALADAGRGVGLLDADIYGPSQQLMMGAEDGPTAGEEGRIRPVIGVHGVKVMSFGYLIDADQPVIWRGPMLQKALEQFVGDVEWGELDELVVDLPPGTGDVALTLCQNVPLAGAVIVTTPQEVALIDARKALQMFRKLEVPVLGLIENMAGFTCPSCGHHEAVFGEGGGRRTAEALGIPFLGSIPLDPAVVAGGDTGEPIVLARPDSPAAQAFRDLARALVERTEGG